LYSMTLPTRIVLTGTFIGGLCRFGVGRSKSRLRQAFGAGRQKRAEASKRAADKQRPIRPAKSTLWTPPGPMA
jgi:hypothetical protein